MPANTADFSTAPVPSPQAQAALARADLYARTADAPATLRAYRADWEGFAAWCATHDFCPVPAEPKTIGAYLASLAETHAPASLRRKLSAIGKMHRFNSLPWNPAHRDIQQPLRGILRRHGRPLKQAMALTVDLLQQLVATCDVSARGRRDRLLLLLGFAGALRRSELVGLQVEDIKSTNDGLTLTVRHSKTDQGWEGAQIGIPRGAHRATCPVRAFDAWQAVALRQAGPLFRRISVAGTIAATALQPYAVQRILQQRAGLAGLELTDLSPHALLPVPPDLLRKGADEPASRSWVQAHWGMGGALQRVVVLPRARRPRGTPRGHDVVRYSFFTDGTLPQAAVKQLTGHWPTLEFALTVRSAF